MWFAISQYIVSQYLAYRRIAILSYHVLSIAIVSYRGEPGDSHPFTKINKNLVQKKHLKNDLLKKEQVYKIWQKMIAEHKLINKKDSDLSIQINIFLSFLRVRKYGKHNKSAKNIKESWLN